MVMFLSAQAAAIDTFVIEDIRVEGLQRVAPGSVFIVLPVQVGDTMNDDISARSIEVLYGTGLFDDVQLHRENNDLIISVVERPTIAEVNFVGNDKIGDEVVEGILRSSRLINGAVFNPDNVNNYVENMKLGYVGIGRFSAQVEVSVIPLERNRVRLQIDILEGDITLIKEIRIVGNENVSDEKIFDIMKLSTKKTLGFLNRNNRYSAETLRADLEQITSHYHNNGYINFELISSRAFISEDREGILIVISLTEGPQYRFGEVTIESTEEVIPQEQLDELLQEPDGSLYSFEQVGNTRNAISNEFANEGFARAQIDPLPTVHDDTQEVDVNYIVKPGTLTYVRRINFSGNIVTDDEVLRREMRIYEGGAYSAEHILLSRARLGRLGIFTSVDVSVDPVPGAADQVDIDVTVQESLTGSLLFGVGYSESEKASLSIGISERNLFGTGKRIALNGNVGETESRILLNYTNPYYTLDGVSRGYYLQYTDIDTSDSDDTSIYDLGTTGFGIRFGIPVSEEGILSLGFRAEQNEFGANTTPAGKDLHVFDFIEEYPSVTSGIFTIGYRKDTRNRAIFADEGNFFNVSAEIAAGDLNYYILQTRYVQYFNSVGSGTLRFTAQADYGAGLDSGDLDNQLPFYRNFYMSGLSSLRGFNSVSLGPKELCRYPFDPNLDPDFKALNLKYEQHNDGDFYGVCSQQRAVGGSIRALGRAEYFMPFFGLEDSDDKRFSAFIDVGNTFASTSGKYYDIGLEVGAFESLSFDNLRAAGGLAFEWLSPIGPFGINYAVPIQKKDGDKLDRFQITLGYLQN